MADMSDQLQDVESDCDSLFNSPAPKHPTSVRWKHSEPSHYFEKEKASIDLTGIESEGHEASRITTRPKQASSRRQPSAVAAGQGERQSSKVRDSSSCIATVHRELDQSRESSPLTVHLHSSTHAGLLTTSDEDFIKQQDSLGFLPQPGTMFNYSSDEDDNDKYLPVSRFRFDSLGDYMKGGISPPAPLVPLKDPRRPIATSLQTSTPPSAEAPGAQKHGSTDDLDSPSTYKEKQRPFDEERSSGDDKAPKSSTQWLGSSPSTMDELRAAHSHNSAQSTAMSKSAALREQRRREKAGLASPAMSASEPSIVHGLQKSNDLDRLEVTGGSTEAHHTQVPRMNSDADDPKGKRKPKNAVGDGEGPTSARSVARVGSTSAVQKALIKGPMTVTISPAIQAPTTFNSPSRVQTQHVRSHPRVQNQVPHSRTSKDPENTTSGTSVPRAIAPVTVKRQLNMGLLKDKISRSSPPFAKADKSLLRMVRRDTMGIASTLVPTKAQHVVKSPAKSLHRGPMSSTRGRVGSPVATGRIPRHNTVATSIQAQDAKKPLFVASHVDLNAMGNEIQSGRRSEAHQVQSLKPPNLSKVEEICIPLSTIGYPKPKDSHMLTANMSKEGNTEPHIAADGPVPSPPEATNTSYDILPTDCNSDSCRYGTVFDVRGGQAHQHSDPWSKSPSFDPASMLISDSPDTMKPLSQSKHKSMPTHAQAGKALGAPTEPNPIPAQDLERRDLTQGHRSDASEASSPEARHVSLEQLDGETKAKAAGCSNGTFYNSMKDASHVRREGQSDKTAVDNTPVSIHANERRAEPTTIGRWECMERSTEFNDERWDNSNKDNSRTELAHKPAEPKIARTVESPNKQHSEAAPLSTRFPPAAQIVRQSSSSAASQVQKVPIAKTISMHPDSITASHVIHLSSSQGSEDSVSFLTENRGDLQDRASNRPVCTEKTSEDKLDAGKAKEKVLPVWATEEALKKLPRDFKYLFNLVEVEKLGFDTAVAQFNRQRAQAKDRRKLYQQYRDELCKAGISKPDQFKTTSQVKATIPAPELVKGGPVVKREVSVSPSQDYDAFSGGHNSDAPSPPRQSIPAPASSNPTSSSPSQNSINSSTIFHRVCNGPVAVPSSSGSTSDCMQPRQPIDPLASPPHAQRKRTLDTASLPETKKARVEVDSKSRAIAWGKPQTCADSHLPIEPARSEATDEEPGFGANSETEESIDEADSELEEYDAEGNGAQFFQYKVFYRCWTEGEEDADVERSLWANGEFESLRRANKFAHGRKKYVDTHKLVRFTDWTRSKDKDDVESYLGKFVDHQNRIGYYKIWTERWLVRKSDGLLPRSKDGFLGKHVFIMRMFRLLQEPDDEHPHAQPIREYYEVTPNMVYTALHYANKKAMEIQLSMSVVEGECRYKLDEKHRQKQVKELGDKLRNLDAKEECWHSQFRALSKWNNAMFEIQVQKAGLAGPRNI